jgi:ABC-2 type transport system permease protein
MILTIWKKELNSYFSSPLAYVLIGLFSLITGTMFFNLVVTYTDGIQSLPPEYGAKISFIDEVILRLFANINFIFLFFIPLLTMKSFAEEKKQETLDVFWLAPIREWEVVFGKSLATLTLVLTLLSVTIVFPLVIWGVGIRDISVLTNSYLSVFFNAVAYISLGLFCSSISSNQIVAGLLAILGIVFLWMISWGGHLNSNFMIAEIFSYIGITSHFERVLKGLIGTQDIIYYLSFILLFSILTVKSLSRRKW